MNFYNEINMNSNAVTGLPTPANASDAATKSYVDSNAAPVTSVNTKTGAVVLSAADIAITDTSDNFTTDTVQGAIDQLFQSANSGKTAIAGAIGSPATSSDTFAQLASAITTGKGQIATATGSGAVSSSSTFTQLADAVSALNSKIYGIEKNVTFDETIAKDDIVESYYKSLSLTRQTQPAGVTPEGTVNGLAWSPDGKQLAVAHALNPFLSIFNYDEATNTFTNSTDPNALAPSATGSIMPPNTGAAVHFSPNGDYLAVAHTSTNQSSIYKRNGLSFIKLPNTTSPGGTNGRSIAFSPDSNYLSVGTSGSGNSGFGIYYRSGETFTRLADGTESYNGTNGTAWSPDSRYTISCSSVAPFFKIMKRTGDGTTATMGRVASSQSVDGIAYSAAWSPDGQYVAIGYDGTSTSFTANKIAIYKQSGDTFTRLSVTNQPALTTSVSGIAWSKDGNYLYLSVNASPSFLTIKRTGDAFAFQSNPTVPFGTTANAVAVHPNNNLISVGHALNQFVTHYQNDGSYLFVKANTNAINPLDKIIGIAKEAGTQGQFKKVDVLVGRSLLP